MTPRELAEVNKYIAPIKVDIEKEINRRTFKGKNRPLFMSATGFVLH